jgi:dTDP-4-amino-4,6-dideoxygalactose transaminase
MSRTRGIPGLSFQHVDPDDVSTYKDLTLIVDPLEFGLTVAQLAAALRAEGIDTRRYYYPPIHRQKAYVGIARNRSLPETELLTNQVLTVPLWSHMTGPTVRAVADVLIALHEHAASIRPHVPSEEASVAQPDGARLGGRP